VTTLYGTAPFLDVPLWNTKLNELNPSNRQRARWNLTILIAMYAGYMAFMLCRNTLIAVSQHTHRSQSGDD